MDLSISIDIRKIPGMSFYILNNMTRGKQTSKDKWHMLLKPNLTLVAVCWMVFSGIIIRGSSDALWWSCKQMHKTSKHATAHYTQKKYTWFDDFNKLYAK